MTRDYLVQFIAEQLARYGGPLRASRDPELVRPLEAPRTAPDALTAVLRVALAAAVAAQARKVRGDQALELSAGVAARAAADRYSRAAEATVDQGVAAHPRLRGYRRVTSTSGCAYCKQTAGPTLYQQVSRFGGARVHRNCSCQSEPGWVPYARDELDARLNVEAIRSGQDNNRARRDAARRRAAAELAGADARRRAAAARAADADQRRADAGSTPAVDAA